jgi:hypothetical protein
MGAVDDASIPYLRLLLVLVGLLVVANLVPAVPATRARRRATSDLLADE